MCTQLAASELTVDYDDAFRLPDDTIISNIAWDEVPADILQTLCQYVAERDVAVDGGAAEVARMMQEARDAGGNLRVAIGHLARTTIHQVSPPPLLSLPFLMRLSLLPILLPSLHHVGRHYETTPTSSAS